jgi:flagellar hook assembly protein FlgD
MISIKVGVGGSGTVPSQQSTTKFADAAGNVVTQYKDSDTVYVKVVDPSHTGETTIANAVTISGVKYNLTHSTGMPTDTFMTAGITLDLVPNTTITATYEDPQNPTDKTSATAQVIASELVVTSFYAAPTPSSGPVTFGYEGSGIAATFSVEVRDWAGHILWTTEQANKATVVWDGKTTAGQLVANGVYRYFVTVTGGATPKSDDGIVVINR